MIFPDSPVSLSLSPVLQAEKAAPPAVSPDTSKRVKKSKKAKHVEVRVVNAIALCSLI